MHSRLANQWLLFSAAILILGVSASADQASLNKLENLTQYTVDPDLSAANQLAPVEQMAFAKFIYDANVVNLQTGRFYGKPIIWLLNNDPVRGPALLRVLISDSRFTYKDAVRLLKELPPTVRADVLQKMSVTSFAQKRPEMVKFLTEAGYRFDFKAMMLTAAQNCDAETLYKLRLFSSLDPNQVTDKKSGLSAVEIAQRSSSVQVAAIGPVDLSQSPPEECRSSVGVLKENRSLLATSGYVGTHPDIHIEYPKDWVGAIKIAKPALMVQSADAGSAGR